MTRCVSDPIPWEDLKNDAGKKKKKKVVPLVARTDKRLVNEGHREVPRAADTPSTHGNPTAIDAFLTREHMDMEDTRFASVGFGAITSDQTGQCKIYMSNTSSTHSQTNYCEQPVDLVIHGSASRQELNRNQKCCCFSQKA